MDYDRITPKDIISGAFYSDGKKEASGDERVRAMLGNKLSQLKKMLKEQADENGVTAITLDPQNIRSASEALMLFETGMATACNALSALGANDCVTDEEKAILKTAMDETIYGIYETIKARCKARHQAENPDCDCHKGDDA